MANYLCLVLGYLGKFLYYKTLTGWSWENLLKKNHSHIQVSVVLLGGIPSPGQLIMPALTLAMNLSFSLLLKLNQSNEKSFGKGGKNLPQLWGKFIWIIPGYGNWGLKSPLCCKQLNHTKNNQSSNIRKLSYVPYRWWCQYIISLKDKDSTELTKSDDLRYTGLSNGSS